jgi:eukaryotic-like serine/threonine-protein kinase
LEDTSPSTRVGSIVAQKYLLEDVLAVGGMGTVYRAEHLFTHQRVALKVISPWVFGPRAADRFLREAEAPSRLRHPSIVQVLDAGREENGDYFLAFELLEGEDLQKAIARKGLDPRQLVEIAVEVLDVLEVAHEAGLVHRDIKPANVFLALDPATGARQVRLLDFGIVKRLDKDESDATTQGLICGSLEFMSPEQALGNPIDGRADLWSIGALLYRGLSGEAAVSAPNIAKFVIKLATQKPRPLRELCPHLPPELTAIVDRSMSWDPTQRFESAREMRDALAGFLSGRHPSSGRSASILPIIAAKRRWLGAAALIVALATGLAVSVLWAQEPVRPTVVRAPPPSEAATSPPELEASALPVAPPAPAVRNDAEVKTETKTETKRVPKPDAQRPKRRVEAARRAAKAAGPRVEPKWEPKRDYR